MRVTGYKAVSTSLDAFASSWVVTAMVRACDAGADLLNLSLGVYLDPMVDAEEYLMWVEAVDHCRARGTALIAAAGNDHVRIDRVDLTVGGRELAGVGQVDPGDEGIALVFPGDPIEPYDLRGTLLAPGGVPGVVMVSATSNTVGHPTSTAGIDRMDGLPVGARPPYGATDQLAYYSNYGSRVDVAAAGGARKFNVADYDGGYEDVLYSGWGQLGPLAANGALCRVDGDLLFFACFRDGNDAYGWLQGTSVSTADATGIAALALSAHRELRGDPDALVAHLQATARTDMENRTGVNAPLDHRADVFGSECATGYCYTDFRTAIGFAHAYGAGLLDAQKAVTRTP